MTEQESPSYSPARRRTVALLALVFACGTLLLLVYSANARKAEHTKSAELDELRKANGSGSSKPASELKSIEDFLETQYMVDSSEFRTEKEAMALKLQLEKADFESESRTGHSLVNGKIQITYSLRLGTFATQSGAEALHKKLKAAGFEVSVHRNVDIKKGLSKAQLLKLQELLEDGEAANQDKLKEIIAEAELLEKESARLEEEIRRIRQKGERQVHEAVNQEEMKKKLTPEQYNICFLKGTEPPGSGKYNKHYEPGEYHCVACDALLFKSDTKFDSGTGWPSFWDGADPDAIAQHVDCSHGMTRTEVTCAKCGAHLGHVFSDGPEPTGQRYCINSLALEFVPEAEAK